MKKILLIITTFLFIASTVFPQTKVNEVYLLEYDGKKYLPTSEKPYTGEVFDLHKRTGKKKLEGQYRNGMKDGKWTRYRQDGKKREKGTYNNGKMVGTWIRWDISGQKMEEAEHKDGKQHGKKISWNRNGKKYWEIFNS